MADKITSPKSHYISSRILHEGISYSQAEADFDLWYAVEIADAEKRGWDTALNVIEIQKTESMDEEIVKRTLVDSMRWFGQVQSPAQAAQQLEGFRND